MPYVVLLKKSTEKDLDRLPAKIHDRIVEHLISLREDPRHVGTKKLREREGYRMRVGDYRILYTIDDAKKEVEVFSVAHRREVY